MKYPDKLVGEEITDEFGTVWRRTNRRDMKSTYADNYYYMPTDCFCDTDVTGCGYTFSDEWGDCDYCLGMIRQIHGHNDGIEVDFDDPMLFT